MTTSYARNVYQSSLVNTSTHPLDLVIMLYDGSIGFLGRARDSIQRRDVAEKAKYISKANAIIEELLIALDIEKGGEVAANLQSLYLYMMKQISLANADNNPDRLAEVEGLLRTLRDAWKEVRASAAIT